MLARSHYCCLNCRRPLVIPIVANCELCARLQQLFGVRFFFVFFPCVPCAVVSVCAVLSVLVDGIFAAMLSAAIFAAVIAAIVSCCYFCCYVAATIIASCYYF